MIKAAGCVAFFTTAVYGATIGTLSVQDHPATPDPVLRAVAREVKRIPDDTATLIGDAASFMYDEVADTLEMTAALLRPDVKGKVKREALAEVAAAWDLSGGIEFRSYRISRQVGEEMLAGIEPEAGQPVDVRAFFAGIDFPRGTSAFYRPDFGRLAVRQTLEQHLHIEDILAEHHHVQRDLMGHQVEIKTKFIEVSQSTLNELGFSWAFEGKRGGNPANLFDGWILPAGQDVLAAGLRTSAGAFGGGADPAGLLVERAAGAWQWSLIISALEQAGDSEVLCEPSITTRDGRTANIWVGEQRMVPKGFRAGGRVTSVYVEHDRWESELIGVHLEVTPELRQGGLIDLELKPRLIDLIGYDTYAVTPGNTRMLAIHGAPPSAQQMSGRYPVLSRAADGTLNTVGRTYNAVLQNTPFKGQDINSWDLDVGDTMNKDLRMTGSPVHFDSRRNFDKDELLELPQVLGSLPNFRVRHITTEVTIADGSTVGMGGLIYDKLETYRDKVPVLGSVPFVGRLFRSEGERNIKRNLMIFVTATQVDVNGRRAADLAARSRSH